jgi:hypothetical protein
MEVERKVWVVEEVPTPEGYGQRQTMGRSVQRKDGSWRWVRPDDELTAEERAEWNRVMEKLRDVGGEDLRHLVCCAGLLDHCTARSQITPYK